MVSIKERIATQGRTLGPAERASVIRNLECQVLAAHVMRDDHFKKWRACASQMDEYKCLLALAVEADAILRSEGR